MRADLLCNKKEPVKKAVGKIYMADDRIRVQKRGGDRPREKSPVLINVPPVPLTWADEEETRAADDDASRPRRALPPSPPHPRCRVLMILDDAPGIYISRAVFGRRRNSDGFSTLSAPSEKLIAAFLCADVFL